MRLNVLTSEELYTLTKYKRKAEQKEWLKNNGIRFLEAADGSPNVSVDLVNTLLGVDISFTKKKKPELDLKAISNYGKSHDTKAQTK